jgi:phosphoribosylformimino-5-aminoimidazole carboxamide ribotide isomerase
LSISTELIAEIVRSIDLQVEVGGGVRSTDDVRTLLGAGVSRVVVGTKAIEDWPWFQALMRQPEFERKIVLALDAKEGRVATRGWTETTGRLATDVAKDVSDEPLAAILYTDVAKDGMLQGPNLQQTRAVAEAGKVPVIASGGVGNIEHIRAVRELPVWGVIVGRSLYEGAVDLREAIGVARGGVA